MPNRLSITKKRARKRAKKARCTPCDAARIFFEELLDSVETLGGVADQYGVPTLTDLVYLMGAIQDKGLVQEMPGTQVVKLVKRLPSANRWLQYIIREEES